MQVVCGVHSGVSAQGDVWVDTQRARNNCSGIGAAQREQGGGGASSGGLCAYDADDPTEALGVRGGGIYQGEERHSNSAKVHGSEEELCGVELLGTRVLRVDGGEGRSAGAQLHPRKGKRRSTARSTEDVRVTSKPGRSRPDRFERVTTQASGFAGGT
jgi:hypothetical protein